MPVTIASAHQPPPSAAMAAIIGPSTKILRRVDILEQDLSHWKSFEELGVLDGSTSIDSTRPERRAFELTLDNSKGEIRHAKGNLWYDKIVRLYRGVRYKVSGTTYDWYSPLGEYMIDEISSQHFPHTISIKGRDYTKKMLNSVFKVPTSFPSNTPIENLIRTIATNAGINPNKMILPVTGHSTGASVMYDAGTTRWQACDSLAQNFNYDLYFDGAGYLVMRPFQDPSKSGSAFTFETGAFGNLVSYQKTSRDTRLYNSVVVTGQQANKTPVYGFAQNTQPNSPTNITEIGERVFRYTSSFIYTQAQATETARKFLALHSLEEYDLSLESIVFPWLEGADVIDFKDPDPDPDAPTRFLLSSFSIPLALGSMSSSAKRVVLV